MGGEAATDECTGHNRARGLREAEADAERERDRKTEGRRETEGGGRGRLVCRWCQKHEQGRRAPLGPEVVLLLVAARLTKT